MLAGPVFLLVILNYVSTSSLTFLPTFAYVIFLEKISYETGDSLTMHFHCLVLYTYFIVFPEPISFL